MLSTITSIIFNMRIIWWRVCLGGLVTGMDLDGHAGEKKGDEVLDQYGRGF